MTTFTYCSSALLTRMEAKIAGSEHVRVRTLKQPHKDANRIDRTTKFCLSTDPYTLSPSPRRFSRVSEEIGDDFCAIIIDWEALTCTNPLLSFSVAPDLLLMSLCACAKCTWACSAQSNPVAIGPRPFMVCKVGVVTSVHFTCTYCTVQLRAEQARKEACFKGELTQSCTKKNPGRRR